MPPDARTYLWHILSASDAIARFVEGMDADRYAASEMVYSAVERKFEIIGEALGQLSRLDPTLAARVPDVRRIIAFRNILIHGYASIEHIRVWETAEGSLPALRKTITALLDELGPL